MYYTAYNGVNNRWQDSVLPFTNRLNRKNLVASTIAAITTLWIALIVIALHQGSPVGQVTTGPPSHVATSSATPLQVAPVSATMASASMTSPTNSGTSLKHNSSPLSIASAPTMAMVAMVTPSSGSTDNPIIGGKGGDTSTDPVTNPVTTPVDPVTTDPTPTDPVSTTPPDPIGNLPPVTTDPITTDPVTPPVDVPPVTVLVGNTVDTVVQPVVAGLGL